MARFTQGVIADLIRKSKIRRSQSPLGVAGHEPSAIGHSFNGKSSFFSNAVDPIEAFCIFVSPKQKGKQTSIL
jgi:hypothetical protein